MTRQNISGNATRQDWMTQDLEKKLQSISRNGKVDCALVQQFARENNLEINKMRQFMDVLGLKVQNCQLGCF